MALENNTPVEVIKYLVNLAESMGINGPMVAVVCVLATMGFFCIPRALLAADWHERRGHARVEALLNELNKRFTWENAYAIEQVFLRYYKSLIDHRDLVALLSRANPSASIRDFLRFKRIVRIRHEDSEFAFRSGFSSRGKRVSMRIGYILMYLVTVAAGTILFTQFVVAASNNDSAPALFLASLGLLSFAFSFSSIKAYESLRLSTRLVCGRDTVNDDIRKLLLSARLRAAVTARSLLKGMHRIAASRRHLQRGSS